MNLRHYWKAILAFGGLVVTNASASLMESGEPWPADGAQWARWGVTIVAGTALVYAKRNAPKVDAPKAAG